MESPGEELDAMVAEKVFGRVTYRVWIGSSRHGNWRYSYLENPIPFDIQGSLEWDDDDFVPKYSEDMGKAWEVADYIVNGDPIKNPVDFSLRYDGSSRRFFAKFQSTADRSDLQWSNMHTYPAMAICLAALEKVRYDKEVADKSV